MYNFELNIIRLRRSNDIVFIIIIIYKHFVKFVIENIFILNNNYYELGNCNFKY